MLHASTAIRFGPLSDIFGIVPAARAVFVTSRSLRTRAEAMLLEAQSGAPSPAPASLRWIEVADGESCKSFQNLEAVCRALLSLGADTETVLVAIGGGSVSDLAGLAAHIWNRGIRFITCPTTLLSMIDASIGGKNAIDLDSAKNVVGSFHTPSEMLCDVRWLATLPARDIASGFAEAIKHAVLDGEEHFSFFEKVAVSGIAPQDLDQATLEGLIRRSLAVKERYVRSDPRDAHERHALNYGHTFGHAIELLTGLPHGFAVAAGIGAVNALAERRGVLAHEDAVRIAGTLNAFGLPTSIDEACSLAGRTIGQDELLERMRADKKRRGDEIRFAMPHGIGDVRVEPVSFHELEKFLGLGAAASEQGENA